MPDTPTTKKGWTGIGCAIGSIMVFGANHERIVPNKKLDFILATVMNGNRDRSSDVARNVIMIPEMTRPSETAMAVNGPLNAKSKIAARFFGKDRKGVTHPKNGTVVK